MKKILAISMFVLALAVIPPTIWADCAKTACEPFEVRGKVRFVGDFWGIVAENGRCYNPIYLPPELRVEGKRARFTLRAVRNQFNFPKWGMRVEIVGYNLAEKNN